MILCFVPWGFEGKFITIEADVRPGMPGMNIVGLPDTAVRESKERVRLAIKNSGYRYPDNRIVVNLAPADVKKEGASFDLGICLAILITTGQIYWDLKNPLLVLGELLLSGGIRPVNSILSALTHAQEENLDEALIPEGNILEAQLLQVKGVRSISHLKNIQEILNQKSIAFNNKNISHEKSSRNLFSNFSSIKGQDAVKRVISICIAGRHNLLLFGPPGSGKTFSCSAIGSVLTGLNQKDSLEVTRLWSQAGLLNPNNPLISFPPIRSPHHSASLEGMLGGGKEIIPGEISLAHNGILFLDEAPEFPAHVLQGLREPLESRNISIVRAGKTFQFPADFQLIITANPCPCGNLGKSDGVCLCSKIEIRRYWKRIGGALLDRTDLRLPVSSVNTKRLMRDEATSSEEMLEKIERARERQQIRFEGEKFYFNGRIPPHGIVKYCHLSKELEEELINESHALALSSRAIHSVLKVALTIADLDDKKSIDYDSLIEAIQYRRFGDSDIFWRENL